MKSDHMKADHEGAVRRVAEFIGFGDDDERIAIACQEATLASMQAHHDKSELRDGARDACNRPLRMYASR